MARKPRRNPVLLEWQRTNPGEIDTSPEGKARTLLFANGASFALEQMRKHISGRRYRRMLRDIAAFKELCGHILITPTLVVRRAIELFRNSNPHLRMLDEAWRADAKPGASINIRLPVDYKIKAADLER